MRWVRTVQVKADHVIMRVQKLFDCLETSVCQAVVFEIKLTQHVVHIALQRRGHGVSQLGSAEVQCFERVVLSQCAKQCLGHVIAERVLRQVERVERCVRDERDELQLNIG